MAKEIINEIMDVEGQAQNIIEEAKRKAKELINEASLVSNQVYKEIVEDAVLSVESYLKGVEATERESIQSVIDEGKKEALNLKNIPSGKLDEAVLLIKERILE